METDKEFFRIFQLNPRLLATFLNVEVKGECSLKSETLKALERRIDGVLTFEHSGVVTLLEIQGYRDDAVYPRLVTAMAQYHLENPLLMVHGVIIFLKPEFDPCTYPWKLFAESSQPAIRVLYLEEVLDELAEEDPEHVLLSVFAPLTCRSKKTLREVAPTHYRRLKGADLDPRGKSGLLEAFESWLMARFKNRAEVEQMIVDIPPIEKSAAAKYFTERGFKKGLQRGEKRGEARGEKRGETRAELRELGNRIKQLQQLHREGLLNLPASAFVELLAPLNARLAELRNDLEKSEQ